MSNAASTIPAKRNVFKTKPVKIPSLDDKPKQNKKSSKHFKRGNADVLTVKHKDTGDENYYQENSDQGHFDNEETWMGKPNNGLHSGLDKLDPEKRGSMKQNKDTLPNATNHLLNESNKPTIKVMNIEHYEQFMEERKQLLGLNEKYEKRIAELEEEVTRILGEFAKLYEDNEKLRRKMDTGKEPLLEPYSRVFEDRKILREAESGYKKRIVRLEKEIMEKQKDCDKFQDEVKALKARVKPTDKAEEKDRITKEMKLQVELRKVKTENTKLMNKVENLEKSNSKPELQKVKSENDSLRSIIRKLENQLSQKSASENKAKTKSQEKAKSRNSSQLYQVTFGDKPIIFDYEYLLPDSQVYD